MIAIFVSMLLFVKVKPNSRENSASLEGDRLVVRVHAPALDGKANKMLVEFLAEALEIPKSRIEIVAGHNAPYKKISVAKEFDNKLKEWLAALR